VLGRVIDMKFTPDLKFLHDESFDAAELHEPAVRRPARRADVEDRRRTGRAMRKTTGRLMARRKKGDAVSGWICLDKPYDLGSTQAVGRVRRLFNAQKAGHAGTLDPLATGILPIALGEATKTVPFLMDADKAYRFTIEVGPLDRHLDREGETTAQSDVRPTSEPRSRRCCRPSSARSDQVPPNYSAIKVDGERAYDLARDGGRVRAGRPHCDRPRGLRCHAMRPTPTTSS
jgi:tRNA U55 pseudouridine synthase TruB